MYLIQELQQFHKNVFALGIATSLSEIRDIINNEHEISLVPSLTLSLHTLF